SDVHSPYFLAFTEVNANIETVRNKLLERWEKNKVDHEKLSKIKEIGKIETYRSFCDFNKTRKVFKVYTKESYVVPEISNYLFFEHNLSTAEHDIPYKQRALTDLAAEDTVWLFDTCGEKKKVKVFVYDIETTQFAEGKKDIPIDIIGYSNFDIVFESEKNLDSEQFSFEILDLPSHWEDIEVKQLVSRNASEEIENLLTFCKIVGEYDIISGHNIAGFDNFQIYERINGILKREREKLSDDEKKALQRFIYKYCRPDKSFHFGTSSEVVQFYPSSFDTYLAARKFYSFLNEFSLKALAPFLGIIVKDRIILTPSQIKIDERTLKYNRQDMQEQIGVTLNLIQQALPL
ncbi:MAG: DNA polymerase elongation subunit (family B), partial [Thermoplasmatales archaeon]|nr:DNA polymerase elongation subunit (family B) [Thermoplasmatales archaeon]